MKIKHTIRFTPQELYWIERTADIESALVLKRFTDNVNQVNMDNLNEEEKQMFRKINKELMDLFTFLKELRVKLEMWDCRYDISKELIMEEETTVKDKEKADYIKEVEDGKI
jgi:hypothetical protein